MTKPNEWSGVALADNRLLLVYPFTVGSDEGLPRLSRPFASLETCTAADFYGVLGKQTATRDLHVWEPLAAEQARKHLSPDLHAVVDLILHGGSAGAGTSLEQGHLPFRVRAGFLTDDFAIELRDAARQRLIAAGASRDGAHYIRFRFHDIYAYLMATGIGLLTLEVEVKAPLECDGVVTTDLLLEGVYALSHPESRGHSIIHGKLQRKSALEPLAPGEKAYVMEVPPHLLESGWKERFGLKKCLGGSLGAAEARGYSVLVGGQHGDSCLVLQEGSVDTTTFGQLAQALLGGVTGNCDQARLFSFAYARTCDAVPSRAVRELALRLSGNYNSQYAVNASDVRKRTQTIFSNIHFAATLQGGAVVVSTDANGAPLHLLEYYKNSARCSYIPLGLLAYHEYLQLKSLLRNCAVPCASLDLEEDAERIKDGREQLLKFRLHFRFSHVSDMAHHNTVHGTWRAALAVDTMLDELSADMAEADSVYRATVESLRAQRWREEQSRMEQEKKERRVKSDQEKEKEHKREKKWRVVGALATLLMSFHFINELAEIYFRLENPPEKWLLLLHKGDGSDLQALAHDPRYAAMFHYQEHLHHVEWQYAKIAMGVAVVCAIIAYFKGPKLGQH